MNLPRLASPMYPQSVQPPMGTGYHTAPVHPYAAATAPAPYQQYTTPTHQPYQPSQPQNGAYKRRSWKFAVGTVSVVPSVVACILVQAVAAFFFISTLLTFTGAIQNADDFSNDPSHDGNVLYIVFSVFTAISSAMCAPMIQNSGYTSVLMAGTVLMLFSTLSSSLVTSAEILVIPYAVFGACAYGLLKTGPQVAMLDFLNNRRALATGLSYLGVTIGQLAATMSFVFTDMNDDANYNGGGNARWPNNLRIIEVTAVIALMCATIIRKPSFNTGSWPELFHYIPFYILCILNFAVSIGFDLLTTVFTELPDDRNFEDHPDGAHTIFTVTFISQLVEFASVILVLVCAGTCCKANGCKKIALLVSAIFVAILAAGCYVNDLTYEDFDTFAIFGGATGFIKAIVRVCLPLALITYAGRLNYKIGLPFLETAGGLGALVSYIIKDNIEMPEDEPIETGWYIAAAAFSFFALGGIIGHCFYKPWDQYVADTEVDQNEINRVNAIENAAFTPDDVLENPFE